MTEQEYLREMVSDHEGKFLSSRMTEAFVLKRNPEMLSFIRESTSFYVDEEIIFSKRIMLILAGKTNRLKCNCGIEISPNARAEYAGGFREFCSQVCSGVANKGRIINRTPEHQSEINSKRELSMIKKHGYAYNSQRPEVKLVLVAAKKSTHSHIKYDILENKELLVGLYKTMPSTEIGVMCNCDYSVVLDYLAKYGASVGDHTKLSQEQRKLGEYIESLGFKVYMNVRILDGKDIDIYLPDLNLGIEYNGFPHHLEHFSRKNGAPRDSTYHQNKTILATELGVRLIHIFPHDLYLKRDIIESILKNALGITERKLAGRKCDVKYVDRVVAKEFLELNHLKGNSTFKVAVGLFLCGELVHVTTFGHSRFDKNYQHEIIRSASKMCTSIAGGFSKCLKFYIKTNCKSGDKIMTYADRAISEGNSYLKSGFTFVRSTSPGYHYAERNNGAFLIHSRYKFQKHKLKEMEHYSDDKTEWEIMVESGFDRYWDSGNNMFEYTTKSGV